MRLVGLLLTVVIGCQAVPATAEPTECEERLGDYCARSPEGCPSGRTFEAFCAWLGNRGTPDEGFSATGCEDLRLSGFTISSPAGERHDYLFDAEGKLAVVFERSGDGTTRCVAGPARLSGQLECVTFTLGYGCGLPAPDAELRARRQRDQVSRIISTASSPSP